MNSFNNYCIKKSANSVWDLTDIMCLALSMYLETSAYLRRKRGEKEE